MQKTSLTLACLILAATTGAADVWTGCVPQVRDVVGDAPLVGDGPLAGDAPDDTDVPVLMSCYTGELPDELDVDRYFLVPGYHLVAGGPQGMRIGAWSLEGCFTATIEVPSTHVHASRVLCEGQRWDLAVLGAEPIRLTFTDGPGVYQFAFE